MPPSSGIWPSDSVIEVNVNEESNARAKAPNSIPYGHGTRNGLTPASGPQTFRRDLTWEREVVFQSTALRCRCIWHNLSACLRGSRAREGTKNELMEATLSGSDRPLETLDDYFRDAIRDIYWAEVYFAKTLPKMMEGARGRELKDAFSVHLEQTGKHVSRLEEVFASLNISRELKAGESIIGILSEAEDVLAQNKKEVPAGDVRLIFAARKAEHYEIGAYGGLITLARRLGLGEAAAAMNRILSEEKETDEILKRIAARHIAAEALPPAAQASR